MRLIDADPLVKIIEKAQMESLKVNVLSLINDAPTVEERPKSKWIRRRIITDKRSFDMWVCLNCQEVFSWDAETGISMDNYNTCPNCGADMRGDV